MKATLIYTSTGDEGTFGHFIAGDFHCRIGTLPWKNNEDFVSCIPPGMYKVVRGDSPTKGIAYRLLDVPHRSDVLIHVFNYCGDITKFLKEIPTQPLQCESEGCIAFGSSVGIMQGQLAVLNSHTTLVRFITIMKLLEFDLQIISTIEPDPFKEYFDGLHA